MEGLTSKMAETWKWVLLLSVVDGELGAELIGSKGRRNYNCRQQDSHGI